MGPVRVELVTDPRRRPGTFEVEARLRQGQGGVGAGSVVLPTGQRVTLGEQVVRIGRLPDCGIQLADSNVSRHHAEIRPSGEGFAVVDLGSTNGTKVNGVRVGERLLRDADEITVGTTKLIFDAS
jgi:pSer/pThr/pTyr-binding forkhead associated (FHA) protein